MKLPHTEIAIRAVKDPKFRERLQATPRKTIQETFDIRVPERVRLKVVEDNAELVHLVVPAKPGERGKEIGIIALTLDQMRKDAVFKARVIKDPKDTFEQMTGLELPDQPRVKVLEDTEDLIHLHLPPGTEDEKFRVEPAVLTMGVYGGGDVYGGPAPEPTTEGPDCTSLAGNNSSTAACCQSDHPNTVSAWDCCFDDEPADDDVLTPF